jgi:Uracil DNA glycosylase superfamily
MRRAALGEVAAIWIKSLNPLGYTVYPRREVKLLSGRIDCAPGAGRRTVYCTDLYPAFPGYETSSNQGQRIRRPSHAQVRSAMERGFLRAELEILNPKAILLLGAKSYAHFYTWMLNMNPPASPQPLVARLHEVDLPRYGNAVVVPFFHPSPASPKFLQWFEKFSSRLPDSAPVKRLRSCL